jgi:acetyl-CoA acetyltransferase family protein
MSPNRTFIVSALRTPIGRRNGALTDAEAPSLLGSVMRAAVAAADVPPDAVEQVFAGCVTQVGDQAYNVARTAWLTAGLPETVPGTTLDAQCGSSHQAVNIAAATIGAGAADLVVAGGVELMSRHPLGSNVSAAIGEPMGAAYREHFEVTGQGEAAERIADRWGIERAECDEIGLRSQQLAAAAWADGRFDAELHEVEIAGETGSTVKLDRDEGPRESTLHGLGALKPAFRPDGRHTAGNSSQISDGASALLLASEAAVERHGLEPLAEVTAQAVVGVDPTIKLTGPIPATKLILERAGLQIEDIDLFEVNEAFASVIGAWLRETGAPLDRMNVNGGAIALGHPVGASGGRLTATAVHELRRRGGGRALVTMCCGGGLGTATLLETVP